MPPGKSRAQNVAHHIPWEVCLRTLETLSACLHARGDTFHAHEAAAAAVRGDPLREAPTAG